MTALATPWDGVPVNPEVDGWHWVCGRPIAWLAKWQAWDTTAAYTSPGKMAERAQVLGGYLGPVRTDAGLGAAWVQARDEAVSRIKHRAGVLRYLSPAVAIELDAVALIVASTVPPPDLGAALAAVREQAREEVWREEREANKSSALACDPAARIPIAAAKRIAEEFGQRQVVLVTWDGETTHVVTYGKSVADCEQAAQGGNFVKKAMGWPEALCAARPARARRKT